MLRAHTPMRGRAAIARALAAAPFVLAALTWPDVVGLLAFLFGIYALGTGVFGSAVVLGAGKKNRSRGFLLLEGFLDVAAAAVVFTWPGMTAFALISLLAAWALATGALEFIGTARNCGE